MSDFLFKEFDQVSAKEWKQKIQVDLKGADYNDTLIWKNIEGIDVKPFYHQENSNTTTAHVPGHPDNWNIAQEIFIDNEIIANSLILASIERGADAVFIVSEDVFNPEIVFKNYLFEEHPIYFYFRFLSEEFILQLKQFFSEKKAAIYYNIDIIGNLARTGNWFHNLKKDHTILESIFQKEARSNIFSVDATLYQNAGANMIQQLAYSLAHANEYLNHFAATSKEKHLKITFNVSVGTNYFFEISKIRALRKLYALIAEEYGISTECYICTKPSRRNKTLYDYNVNLLRTTTENMAAIQGGANIICSVAYDNTYHKSNEFGERIARNQLLILKLESYFNSSDDPAKGSYYIENITQQLSEKALLLFKDIEANGGFLYQLKEGIIQRKIKESAEKEQQLFDSGELELLGTNIHKNSNDHMKNELELHPFVKYNPVKTLIEPIIERRLSEKIELDRLNMEKE